MKRLMFVILLICLVLFSCNNDQENKNSVIETNNTETNNIILDNNDLPAAEAKEINCSKNIKNDIGLNINDKELIDLIDLAPSDVHILNKVQSNIAPKSETKTNIYLLGIDKNDQKNIHDSFLVIVSDESVLVYNLECKSFEDHIYACDVDGNGIDEIVINQLVDMFGGGGQYNSRILKFENNVLYEIFNSFSSSENDNTSVLFDTGFIGTLCTEKKLNISNKYTGMSVDIDISNKYSDDFFDESGIGLYGSLSCDSFYSFLPKDINADGIFEIECLQYTSLTSHPDYCGDAKSVLRYNKDTNLFDIIHTEFLPQSTETETENTEDEITPEPTKPQLVGQDYIIYDKLDNTYDFDSVIDLVSKRVSMYEFIETFPIRWYKSIESKSTYYTVIKTTKDYLIIWFSLDWENISYHNIKFSPISNYDEISKIQVGMTLQSVRDIDPNGMYNFMYAGSQKYPKISNHFFENGTSIFIEYYDNLIIKEIVYISI